MSKKQFIILLLLIAGVLFLYWNNKKPTVFKDELFEKTMVKVDEIYSYSQRVETETIFGNRRIKVVGNHDINRPENRFMAVSTTTLYLLDESKNNEHVFTFDNISIGDDIYTKINTNSEFLKATIPNNQKWQHFTRNSIPKQYINIAISGPVVDNLKLFSENGKYLILIKKPEESTVGGENFMQYTLKLSEDAFKKEGAQKLGILMERINKEGVIVVWIEKKTSTIKYMEFKNPPYYSSTEIININNPPPIYPPIDDILY